MGRFSFGKKEKLCSQTVIDRLFAEGQSFKAFPLRVMVLPVDGAESHAQVLISVPKKRVRKAHDRNRIKRHIREAYRLNKPELLEKWEGEGRYFAIGIIYLSDRTTEFGEMLRIMKGVIVTLHQK
ncbi:MAG: ribonuclease P protein component [Flavobacteriales bacterium]|nr:ribonuclease P protein component [Flavobacteriales bacterium]